MASILEVNTRLSAPQARFALWLEENTPYLLHLFDFNEAIYLEDAVERYLGVASSGEAIMARFVLGVWLHSDKFDFDFTDAAAKLDAKEMQVVIDWMANPFWP